MAEVIGVRFKETGKVYYFDPCGQQLQAGEQAVVETARGVECGEVAIGNKEVADSSIVQPLRKLIRRATKEDIRRAQENRRKESSAFEICEKKIAERGLEMKLVDVEYTFDNSKILFYFTADGRVDFRELVKDLASTFRTRIELRQIGARDETQLLGGIAPCGREVCCAGCMPEFKRVSIKMAKNQGLSLNPGKVSGLCGRLMCCLAYENDYYAEAYKKTPKIGSTISTPEGKGMVVTVNMLKMEVRVKLEKDGGNFVYRDFPISKIGFKRGQEKEEEKDNSDEE